MGLPPWWVKGTIFSVGLEIVKWREVVQRVAGHLTKDSVLVIQPLAVIKSDEKLRSVGVRST